jgi:hypothetical protein
VEIPDMVEGISGIAQSSREPFAARLIGIIGPASVVAASDYPLIDKDRYTK